MPAFSYIAFSRHEPRRSVTVQARSWQQAYLAAHRQLKTQLFVFPADTVPPRDVMPKPTRNVKIVRDDAYGRIA